VCAWATWRVAARRNQLLGSPAERGLVLGGAIVASLGAVVLAAFVLPSVLALAARAL